MANIYYQNSKPFTCFVILIQAKKIKNKKNQKLNKEQSVFKKKKKKFIVTLFESESERVMEDGKRGTLEENIESRGEPLLPADVSWRLNLQEFPALPERRDEHGSIILRRFRRTTGQPSSQILMYICIIFFILFSKVILLFCFLLFLVSFIMARPYFNIE